MVTGITEDILAKLAGLDRGTLSQIRPQDRAFSITESAGADGFELSAAGAYATASGPQVTTAALQLEWERREALEEIDAAMSGLNPIPTELQSKRDAIASLADIKLIRTQKAELRQEIQRAADFQANDKSMNNAELAQEAKTAQLRAEVAQLWKDVKKDEKDVADLMREAWASKDPNSAEYKAYEEWFKQRAKILAMSDDDPKKAELLAKLERQAGRMLRHEADLDEARGDHAHCKRNRDGAKQSDNAASNLDEIHKKSKELREQKNHENTKDAAIASSGIQLSEDDELPITKSHTKGEKKMVVVDANHNEIEAPDGGKNRINSRKIAKTT